MITKLSTWALLLAAAAAAAGCAAPTAATTPWATVEQKRAALQSCQGGGCWIVVRHSATNDDEADTDPLNLDNIGEQRFLSDIGRLEAGGVGRSLATLGVPVGTVVVSRFRRAQETAERAGFVPFTESTDVTEGGLVVPPKENARRAQALRDLVKTTPPKLNGVVVTHKPNIADAFGHEWYTVTPSEITVLRPDPQAEGGYKVLARIKLPELVGLARTAVVTQSK